MSHPRPEGGSEHSDQNEAYSASRHAVQGAGENVQEARDSVSRATASISNLVSGEGNIVDAAMAVKGAVDNVRGLTGRLSATAMMPVMQALSAFKGQAVLPAGKQMDPVIGIDVHMVTIPPSPAPVPMPHPYIGILFNTRDWVSCLINTFKKDALDALPEEKEGEKGIGNSLAKNKAAIVDIAMGLANMSASVKFGGIVPRAVTGTKVKVIPHIPMGAGFHPAFAASVAKNHGKAFLGSLFVVADGDPMVGSFHLNYDCWDVGVVDLFKSQRAGGKKAPDPGGPQAELFVPSGTIMPIPWGRPVLVNSIPTPINPLAILDRVFKAGLGKLKAAARRGMERGLTALRGRVGCGTLSAVSRAIGTGQSHPVDVSGGYFYTDNEDFKLPGPIPLVWQRIWYSNSDYNGPIGHGWHHSYDMALSVDTASGMAVVRMADGRPADFELPTIDKPNYNRSEKLFLNLHEEGYYYVTDKNNIIYRFSQKEYKNCYSNTQSHLLQSMANHNGFAIRFTYDNSGLLIKIIDSSGRVLTINNDDEGRIVGVHAPDPRVNGRSTFSITNYDYTTEGDMAKQTDALNQSMFYEYKNHLMVKETWKNDCVWHFRYDKPFGTDAKCVEVWGDGNLLHYTFDYTDSQRTIATNSLGHKKVFYHKNGVVIKYIDPNGAAWKYRYNKYNELEWKTDPLDNQHTYTYDGWGNIITSTDPVGSFSQIEYRKFNFPFLPTEAIDATGGKWKWEYDENGNIVKTTDPLGAKVLCRYHDGLLSEILYSVGAVIRLSYDSNYNLIHLLRDNESAIEYLYDILGNCIITTNPYGAKQKRGYNLQGNVESVNDFDGNLINLDYDGLGNLISYCDKQKYISYTYGNTGKLTSREEANATMIFVYDTEAQLRKIVNEQGQSYQFKLDPVGNVVEEVRFDNSNCKYERNASGWITQMLRPGGKMTRYSYDPCGRITTVEYDDKKIEAFAYGSDGRLLQAENEFAKVEYERDVVGNILKETVNGEWVASEYDTFSNCTRVTSSMGADMTYQYNALGSIQQIEANNWVAKLKYDKIGVEIERLLPSGINIQWQRDKIGRPLTCKVGRVEGQITNANHSIKYLWDVNDRLLQIKDNNGIMKFEHDAWSNLSKTIYSDNEVQYQNRNAVGNIFETESRNDRIYGDGGQLKKASNYEDNYDAEGNLIERKYVGGETWKYEWNDAGMLTKVIRPDKEEVTFAYDSAGRRLWKRFKNTITRFLWNKDTLLHEWKEHAVSGEKLSNLKVNQNGLITWVFDPGSFIPAAKIRGDKKYSIITDHLGTPYQMYLDGNLFWSGELDSYGKMRIEKGETGSCPFRYQGQYEDIETGLYYNRFRYYDADSGIYLSQDPLKISGGFNMYSYVNDTTNSCDPLGLWKRPISWPSPNNTNVNTPHIVSNHTHGGAGYQSSTSQGGNKDVFPREWDHATIERRVREAYKNADERISVRHQDGHTKHVIRGNAGGYRIEMWYNADTHTIETAYPKGRAC